MAVVSPVSESLQQVTASAIDDMLTQAQVSTRWTFAAPQTRLIVLQQLCYDHPVSDRIIHRFAGEICVCSLMWRCCSFLA